MKFLSFGFGLMVTASASIAQVCTKGEFDARLGFSRQSCETGLGNLAAMFGKVMVPTP